MRERDRGKEKWRKRGSEIHKEKRGRDRGRER